MQHREEMRKGRKAETSTFGQNAKKVGENRTSEQSIEDTRHMASQRKRSFSKFCIESSSVELEEGSEAELVLGLSNPV